MTALSPDQVAAKWAQNLGNAGANIQAGVEAVKVAPGQAAARQKTVYVQNVQAAADKWASRVAGVTLQTWQEAMVTKGVPRVATGASAAQPKMSHFMGQLLPFIDRGVAALPPRGNLAANKQRLLAFVDHMASFTKQA